MTMTTSKLQTEAKPEELNMVVPAFLLLISTIKSFTYVYQATDQLSLWPVVTVIYNDLAIISLVSLISLLKSKNYFSKVCSAFALPALTLFFFLDSVLIALFNSRLDLLNIYLFYSYANQGLSISETIFSSVLLLVISYLIFYRIKLLVKITKTLKYFWIIALSLMVFIPTINFSNTIQIPSTSPLNIFSMKLVNPKQKLPVSLQLHEANLFQEKFLYKIDDMKNKKNLIILIVESLSLYDFLYREGGSDYFPKTTELLKGQRILPNFFCNHSTTEGGLVSLFGGIPPFPTNSSTPDMYRLMSFGSYLINKVKALGYKTYFIAGSDISFRGENVYLREIGIDEIYDTVNSSLSSFVSSNKAFSAVSDDDLLEFALDKIRLLNTNSDPFLLAIESTSTHLPYKNSIGELVSERQAWNEMDKTMVKFIKSLQNEGILKNSVLTIVSDHRKMMPINAEERVIFGSSAPARCALALIENSENISTQIIEKPLSQTDLIAFLLQEDKDSFDPPTSCSYLVMQYTPVLAGEPIVPVLVSCYPNLNESCMIEVDGRDIIFPPSCKLLDEQREEVISYIHGAKSFLEKNISIK